MFYDLLVSKRVWGVIVTGLILLLKHFHIIIPDAVASALPDQAIVIVGSVWQVATKVIDLVKASRASTAATGG